MRQPVQYLRKEVIKMDIEGKKIGFAFTGSFCTIANALCQMCSLVEQGAQVIPIMSETVYSTDTRFGKADDLRAAVEKMTGRQIIHTISEAEPIGPKKLLDALVIAPCTGCTIGKIARGITDTSVTMACKAHLRNARPVIIAVSTNDGLSGSAENIGMLLGRRNIYFVPFGQDDHRHKPTSLVCDFTKTGSTVAAALEGRQFQPILAV